MDPSGLSDFEADLYANSYYDWGYLEFETGGDSNPSSGPGYGYYDPMWWDTNGSPPPSLLDGMHDLSTVVTGDSSRQRPQPQSTWDKFKSCASDHYGLDELAALGAVAIGQPIPGSKRFVTEGSSRGTSVAGMAADKVFGRARFVRRMPTIVGGPGTGRAFAIAGTKSVARFAGRAVPFVGWAMLAYDVTSIALCTASD